MDYFQGVVTEFIRADRCMFVNTEFLIQLDANEKSPAKGRHWYCDALAVNFREETVYLCEVTYSSNAHALLKKLEAWSTHWASVCAAIKRDCQVPIKWSVKPWLFVPKDRVDALNAKIAKISGIGAGYNGMPQPVIQVLEDVVPWKYPGWDRKPAALNH